MSLKNLLRHTQELLKIPLYIQIKRTFKYSTIINLLLFNHNGPLIHTQLKPN